MIEIIDILDVDLGDNGLTSSRGQDNWSDAAVAIIPALFGRHRQTGDEPIAYANHDQTICRMTIRM